MADIYDVKSIRPREALGFAIGRARKTYVMAIERELAAHDISSSQWAVLLNLADGHASTAGELCKVMRYDPGSMTRLLDRLEDKGLLKRVRDESDRRSVHLELTPAGRALRPRIVEAIVRVLNRLLRGFTRAEARQLQELLARVIDNGARE